MRAKEKEGVLGRRFYEDESYELDRFELFVEEQMPADDDDGDGDDASGENAIQRGDEEATQNHRQLLSRRTNPTLDRPDIDASDLSAATKVLHALQASKQAFLTLTDNIIAAGFAIPRSVSVSTHSFSGRLRENHQVDLDEANDARTKNTNAGAGSFSGENATHEAQPEFNTASSTTSRNRRNVYVYAKKEVVVDLSSQEEER